MAKVDIRFQANGEFERPLKLVDAEKWVMVRRADVHAAAPFVISRKEWDQLPREARGEIRRR
jgi:hypothetical protein